MKKFSPLLYLSILAAFSIELLLGVQPASSSFLAVTNTPAQSSPTPLPTEVLTATPNPSPTFIPSPTLSPTNSPIPGPSATPTAGATQSDDPTPTQPASGLPVLGNGQIQSSIPSLASPVTRIVIPALVLDARVKGIPYQGTDWDVTSLGASVGWLEGTSNPRLNRNTILVGHLNLHGGIAGPFEKLGELQTDSKIFVFTRTKAYTYTVSKRLVVEMTDTAVLNPNSLSQLTLITCYPPSWDAVNDIYLLRLVVVAKLLAVEDLGGDERDHRLISRSQID